MVHEAHRFAGFLHFDSIVNYAVDEIAVRCPQGFRTRRRLADVRVRPVPATPACDAAARRELQRSMPRVPFRNRLQSAQFPVCDGQFRY